MRPRKRKYSDLDLEEALQEKKSGRQIKAVSKAYKNPMVTLYNYKVKTGQTRPNQTNSVSDIKEAHVMPRSTSEKPKTEHKSTKKSVGQTALTVDQEAELGNWIKMWNQRGIPPTGLNVRLAAKRILQSFPRQTRLVNDLPSGEWLKGFVKRNPCFITRNSANASVSVENLEIWWEKINKYFAENDYLKIFDDPRRVCNCDEIDIGFNITPKQKTGEKSGNSIILVHTIVADGSYMKPFLIYQYALMPSRVQKNIPTAVAYTYNDSGLMLEAAFKYYLEFVFFKEMQKKGVPFPVILFLENRSSRISMEVTELCERLQIILVSLYPNAAILIQPLDYLIFDHLKAKWHSMLMQKRFKNKSFEVSFENVAELIVELLQKEHSTELVKIAFGYCGIYEWNKTYICFCKIVCVCNRTRVQSNEQLVYYNESRVTSIEHSDTQQSDSNLDDDSLMMSVEESREASIDADADVSEASSEVSVVPNPPMEVFDVNLSSNEISRDIGSDNKSEELESGISNYDDNYEVASFVYDKSAIYTRLKGICGPEVYDQMNDINHVPRSVHEDVLMRILDDFRQNEVFSDLQKNPLANTRKRSFQHQQQPNEIPENEGPQTKKRKEEHKNKAEAQVDKVEIKLKKAVEKLDEQEAKVKYLEQKLKRAKSKLTI